MLGTDIRWTRVALVVLACFAGLAIFVAYDHQVARFVGIALPVIAITVLLPPRTAAK